MRNDAGFLAAMTDPEVTMDPEDSGADPPEDAGAAEEAAAADPLWSNCKSSLVRMDSRLGDPQAAVAAEGPLEEDEGRERTESESCLKKYHV